MLMDGVSNTFDINIPSDFTVYERSWLHYQYWEYEPESYMGYNLKSEIEIDGNTINSMPPYTDTKCGQITPTQLSPDIFHTIGLYVSNYFKISLGFFLFIVAIKKLFDFINDIHYDLMWVNIHYIYLQPLL